MSGLSEINRAKYEGNPRAKAVREAAAKRLAEEKREADEKRLREQQAAAQAPQNDGDGAAASDSLPQQQMAANGQPMVTSNATGYFWKPTDAVIAATLGPVGSSQHHQHFEVPSIDIGQVFQRPQIVPSVAGASPQMVVGGNSGMGRQSALWPVPQAQQIMPRHEPEPMFPQGAVGGLQAPSLADLGHQMSGRNGLLVARSRIDQAGIAAQHDSIDSFLQEFSGFVPQTRSKFPSAHEPSWSTPRRELHRRREPKPPSPPLTGRRAPPRPHFARDAANQGYECRSNTMETPRGYNGSTPRTNRGLGSDPETQRILQGFAAKGIPGMHDGSDRSPDGEYFEEAPAVFIKAEPTPVQRNIIPSKNQFVRGAEATPKQSPAASATPQTVRITPEKHTTPS